MKLLGNVLSTPKSMIITSHKATELLVNRWTHEILFSTETWAPHSRQVSTRCTQNIIPNERSWIFKLLFFYWAKYIQVLYSKVKMQFFNKRKCIFFPAFDALFDFFLSFYLKNYILWETNCTFFVFFFINVALKILHDLDLHSYFWEAPATP